MFMYIYIFSSDLPICIYIDTIYMYIGIFYIYIINNVWVYKQIYIYMQHVISCNLSSPADIVHEEA